MLVFRNRGLINTTALTTSGVSVKETDHPIGKFGTGVKYAIAIVLRLRGKITVWRGRKAYVFGTKEKTVRGQVFRIVTMNGRELGYTDQLGGTWEPWQAYRELWSNARDEGGSVYRTDGFDEVSLQTAGETRIVVECPELERAHDERHRIILQTEPLVVCPGVEVHAGVSRNIFFRGIKVHEFPEEKTSLYTYNLTDDQELTEDRTLKNTWWTPHAVARALVQCTNVSVLMDVCGEAASEHWERGLPFGGLKDQKPSPQFMEAADQLHLAKKLRGGASDVFAHYRDTIPGYTSMYLAVPTAAEEQMIEAALSLVRSIFGDGAVPPRTSLVFKSNLEYQRVQHGKTGRLMLDAKLLSSVEDMAIALIEGVAMLSGGRSTATQLATFVLKRKFAPAEKSFGDAKAAEWEF